MIGGYSDIDLRIIVKDEFFEEYRANKKQRAKNWGNVLFYEDDPLANYSVAHFSSFIKVDSFYYQTEEMYYALQCVDTLRFLVAAAWLMEAGIQPNTLGDWAKMEGSRSNLQNWQLTLLANWDCSRDSVKILHVLHCIIVEYKKVHNNLCRDYHIAENPEWVDGVFDMIL
ncbi:hypothetical protein MHL86_08080 [Brevibacillus laterosporus]|nr:hypothetical protein [Brevibacillus laterosporus]MCG7317206.1 hypothetical protein [Brevibacillus laterosporus]